MNSNRPDIDDIEETEDAILQRCRLKRVREFLLLNGGGQDLIEAIDIAIEDIERWIDPTIEMALGSALEHFGRAQS